MCADREIQAITSPSLNDNGQSLGKRDPRTRRHRGRGDKVANNDRLESESSPPGLVRAATNESMRSETIGDTASKTPVADVDDEAEVCFICAEPVQFSAITACNHRTCHICALRLRALYHKHSCAYCKAESSTILFTLPSEKLFTDYNAADIAAKDEKLGISFEELSIMEETMILLQFNCPVDTCDIAASGFANLKAHVKQAHHLLMCDLCVKNKKVFSHEHELFTSKQLQMHCQVGDRSAHDKSGFKGHPDCGFCHRAFYDDDELYKHCRDKHERCHVCDQLHTGPGRAQYFQNYTKLNEHFRHEHFVCPDPSCLEQKFVVFGSEIDLKAHQIEVHPNGMSGQARKDARKVQTSFAGYEGPANARGNRRGRPEIHFQQSTPSTTHMSREQQALQRQFEYQQSRAQMSGFGSALTEPDPPLPPPPPPQAVMQVPVPSPAVQEAPPLIEAFPALGGSANSIKIKPKGKNPKASAPPKTRPQNGHNPTPTTTAEMSKHQMLLEKVKMISSYDEEKVALYKTNIAQFRSTNIGAAELITNLHTIFQVGTDVLSTVITGSADILDNDGKKTELLAAWNDWKIQHAPDRPVVATSGGGQRVLNIKSRASRTASQTSSVWNTARGHDSVHQAAQKLSSLRVANGGRGGQSYTPAWSAANSTPASGTSTPARQHEPTKAVTAEFPSLPPGTRTRVDTSRYFNKSGWGQPPSMGSHHSVIGPEDYEPESETAVVNKAGKKKPKKQLLFSQGLQRG